VSEEERKDLIDEEQGDDVEAHRKSSGGMTEDADAGDDVEAHRKSSGGMTEDADDGDDVEAHRQHGGVGRQHGGA
jgi:hypothetical protein